MTPFPSALISRFFFLSALAFLVGCNQTTNQRTPSLPPEELIVPAFFIETLSFNNLRANTMRLPKSGEQIQVVRTPVLDFTHLHNVHLIQVDLGMCLLFQMNEQGARDLFRLTLENPGRRLVLTLNGMPVGMRLIEGNIRDGMLFMFVDYTDEVLPELTMRLQESLVDLRRRL
jgi:hypothetical protein